MLAPKVLDLNSIVTENLNMLNRVIGEDIELVMIPGSELGAVKADPGQIEQVIMNLAVNARDAMRSEEHTSELQSQSNLVCRLLLEKKKQHPKMGPKLETVVPSQTRACVTKSQTPRLRMVFTATAFTSLAFIESSVPPIVSIMIHA